MKRDSTSEHVEAYDGTIKEINCIIDIRDFLGTPGYANLVIAANATNRKISAYDIELFLGFGKNQRPASWIRKRRWLFRQPGTSNNYGGQPNLDGKQERALQIMRANRTLSLRDLALTLKDHGIKRGREWIRMHRCD